MGNNAMMTFGDAYEAPDVQVTEVLVEREFDSLVKKSRIKFI